ncbi:hypothetical protein N0V90_000052 [Kalmusia sp. IMI 367209]|nr:hypothetical protein N0V90_000052 [Kalmusia sp. IMI 367209]
MATDALVHAGLFLTLPIISTLFLHIHYLRQFAPPTAPNMLFVALITAGLSVLPTLADQPKLTKFLGPCNAELDGVKQCGPNGYTPWKLMCNGKAQRWMPIGELCPSPMRAIPPDGDWHIGCYGDSCDRYRHYDPELAVLDPRADLQFKQAGSSPRQYSDWLDIPDRDAIDTRCSLTSIDLVETFQDGEWIHHYKCPAGTSCVDLQGRGTCKAGEHEYTVPGLSYLWVFICSDPVDSSTCRFPDSTAKYKSVKPQEPYLVGNTQCSPNQRVVQHLDGQIWTDMYACKAEAICIDSNGRGSCQLGQSSAHQLHSRSDAEISGTVSPTGYQPPTRCNPDTNGHVQFYSEYWDEWMDFHTCEYREGCISIDGKAACDDETQYLIPYPELPNGPNGWHPAQHQNKNSTDVYEGLTRIPTQTRCDPSDDMDKLVQYLHPTGQWLHFYECRGHCKLFPEFAACEEDRNKYVVPSPPKKYISRSVPVLPRAHRDQFSKCDTSTSQGVLAFTKGYKVAWGKCPGVKPCRDVDGSAVCDVDGYQYIMNNQNSLESRKDPYNSFAPEFHTFDTRCNPNDLGEVQRFNRTLDSWVHHFTCTFKDACIDVGGYGTCRLRENVHELPSANYSSVEHEPINPLRIETKCNESNATEVLEWHGGFWNSHGVCLPPYQCRDFGDRTGFAFCAHPDVKKGEIWMPWPSLGRGTNNGLVTRCKSGTILEEFKNDAWVPFRRCQNGFECRDSEDSPHNGGCVAFMDLVGMRTDDSENYGPSGFARPKLPKRGEPKEGLLTNSERVTAQGEFLMKEGEDLMAQSDAVLETFFGPRDGIANPVTGSLASSSESESDTESDEPSRLVDPHASHSALIRSATPTDSKIRRRDSGGLFDDSLQMHRQGQHLVTEGQRLIAQGRELLHTIFGERTDEYIKNLTEHSHRMAALTAAPSTVPSLYLTDAKSRTAVVASAPTTVRVPGKVDGKIEYANHTFENIRDLLSDWDTKDRSYESTDSDTE